MSGYKNDEVQSKKTIVVGTEGDKTEATTLQPSRFEFVTLRRSFAVSFISFLRPSYVIQIEVSLLAREMVTKRFCERCRDKECIE